MVKPRIVVIDPSGEGRAAVSSVVRFRRWHATEMDAVDAPNLPATVDVVLAVEDKRGSGTAALRHVRQSGSPAARILVCDARIAARVVARGEPAHQVVVRPASSEKVLAAVKRSLRVRDLLVDPQIRVVVASFGSLPTMPRTWMRLTELMESDTATLRDAANLVERDVGLSAKVLQLVNSGMMGLDRPIGSLFGALQRMGMATVRDLVLSVELFDGLEGELADTLGPLPLLQMSHLVGTAARAVAPKAAVDTAFSAGLFHQLGRLVLATQAPVRYRKVLALRDGGLALDLAEAEIFGIDARALAAWLLASWGLPHEVIEAVRWCDRPENASGRGAPLALSVFLAARLVEEAALARQGNPATLVSRAELAPWGLAESLEGWRERVRELLDATLEADEQARTAVAS